MIEKKPWDKTPEEFKEAREKANAEATDWHATCRVCHQELTGTLKQLKEHVCVIQPR